MFIKRVEEMRRNGQELVAAGGQARALRLLTKSDDIGFGLSDLHIAAGTQVHLQSPHHWQAHHILSGSGAVHNLASGETWALAPSVAFNVAPADRYKLRADRDMHLLSITAPPLMDDGSPAAADVFAPSHPITSDPPEN